MLRLRPTSTTNQGSETKNCQINRADDWLVLDVFSDALAARFSRKSRLNDGSIMAHASVALNPRPGARLRKACVGWCLRLSECGGPARGGWRKYDVGPRIKNPFTPFNFQPNASTRVSRAFSCDQLDE